MTTLGEMKRLERWMTPIRWFGVFFGVVGVLIRANYADAATETLAWAVVGLLTLGTIAIWASLRYIETLEHRRTLNLAAFVFDTLVLTGLVWVYASGTPYVTWALLFVIPLEGAFRFRMHGAVAGAAVVAVFFVLQSVRVAQVNDASFDVGSYVFVVGLAALIAGIAGAMADNWHAQRDAFQRQSLQLAEIDRLKDRFLAVTSHEIRGPLTAVITGVETVKKRRDRLTIDQQEHILDMVALQARQLARLVDDLTLTSQLQSGQLALRPEWVDLEITIAQALEAAAGTRRDHQLHLFVEPISCELDASRVGQIVRNLVENAYKYTPDRTKVAVTVTAVDHGILLKVDDTGPGIPPDKRDQLFEAFSRIEETAAGREGVGLGLYVVSQVVSAMGGRIDLASSSRGTTFSIYIPCATRSAGRRHLGLITGASLQS